MTHGKRILRAAHASYRGGSHEKDGRPCQDDSSEFYCKDYAIACVADGHGSDRYVRSNKGANFAVDVTIDTIRDYMDGGASQTLSDDPEGTLDNIIRTIIARWNSMVISDFQENPLSSSEAELVGDMSSRPIEKLYGTTLIAGMISKDYSFGIQIGDGNFVIVKGDEATMPMPDDPECTGNLTTSLCDISAISKFRKWYSNESPSAIFVSTDGLYTTFLSDSDYLRYCQKMVDLCIFNQVRWDLVGINLEKRAHAGHGDDVSVSMAGFGESTWTSQRHRRQSLKGEYRRQESKSCPSSSRFRIMRHC